MLSSGRFTFIDFLLWKCRIYIVLLYDLYGVRRHIEWIREIFLAVTFALRIVWNVICTTAALKGGT